VTDIPEPLKSKNPSRISSNTGKGRVAGPALKLKILAAIVTSQIEVEKKTMNIVRIGKTAPRPPELGGVD
jgi:hypothetical protein